jgi:hypothetical protein
LKFETEEAPLRFKQTMMPRWGSTCLGSYALAIDLVARRARPASRSRIIRSYATAYAAARHRRPSPVRHSRAQLRNQRATSKTGDPANLGFTFTGPPAQSAPRSRPATLPGFFFKKRGYVHKGLEAALIFCG